MEHRDRWVPAGPVRDGQAPREPHHAARESSHTYAPPRLAVFGDLERLTTRVGSKGKKDGGGSRRTGF